MWPMAATWARQACLSLWYNLPRADARTQPPTQGSPVEQHRGPTRPRLVPSGPVCRVLSGLSERQYKVGRGQVGSLPLCVVNLGGWISLISAQ